MPPPAGAVKGEAAPFGLLGAASRCDNPGTVPARTPPRYDLVGGRLCLDYCNTAGDRTGVREERFTGYPDVVGWAWRAGVLNAEEAGRLTRLGSRNPTEALLVHERALRLRESLRTVFGTLAAGRRIRSGMLGALNLELASAMARSQVVPTDQGFTWLWAEGGKALDSMLWPVARSAADLLTEGPLDAIRACEGRGCGWLFLDTSRNRTRRWCTMQVCGNRAKARRHHERAKLTA
jgi:predicted RNA-binding Zn ribbon-like protein